MRIDSKDILGELERLAAACPWDRVDLWVTRLPEGAYSFTAYVADNDKFGFKSAFGHGESPSDAVDSLLKGIGDRDPELSRKKAIAELQAKIEALQQVVIGLPPYRPNRELAEANATIRVPDTLEV